MLCKLVFILTIVLTPRTLKEPEVISVDNYGVHTIGNPLPYPVRVTLNCGSNWAPMVVTVPAKDLLVFKVSEPGSNYAPRCFVASFDRLKK